MNFPPVDISDLQAFINGEDEDKLALMYTLQIGRVFCAISMLEQSALGLLLTQTGPESDITEELKNLRKSTFGKLVNNIRDKGVGNRDIKYLRELNTLRNSFIHSLFWELPFPGDPQISLSINQAMIRKLEKWHTHFRFAEANLANIFIRADLFDVYDLGDAGRSLVPKGAFDKL